MAASAEPHRASRRPTSRQPFVGRYAERATLEERWAAALDGVPQTVFVGGEAGAGKSRLANEVADALAGQQVTVLTGACVNDLGAAYDPFVHPVQTLLADPATSPSDDHRAMLRLMIDGTAERAPQAQFAAQLFGAVTDLLAQAANQPLLVVLDDVHWAGESALRMLTWVVEHLRTGRVLILATYRSTLPDRTPQLMGAISGLYRHDTVERIDLDGLATDEICEYLRVGHGASLEAARRAAALLRDHTGGNPFLLREVCRTVQVQEMSTAQSIERVTPDAVRAAAQVRLELLEPRLRTAVEFAAVIGEYVPLALLLAVLPSDVTAADGLAAVDLLIEGGWLEPEQAGSAVRFPHALARGSVLEAMPELDRARAHARVASTIESSFPALDHRIQRLAHHFSRAAVLGHQAAAQRFLAEAAAIARTALAHADAAELFIKAAALAEQPEDRDDLRLEAAKSLLQAGHMGRARDLNAGVFLEGASPQRLRAAVGFEACTWRSGGAGYASVGMLRTALGESSADENDPVMIRAVAALGRALTFIGDPAGMDLGSHAIALARLQDNPALLASVLQRSLQEHADVESMGVRLARAEEVCALAERLGALHHMGAGCHVRCEINYIRGDRNGQLAALAALRQATVNLGQPYWHWALGNFTFASQLAAADFSAAATTLAEGRPLLRLLEETPGAGDGAVALQEYMLRRETGRLQSIRSLVTGQEDVAESWSPGLLALYTELGMESPARRVLARMLEHEIPRLSSSSSWPTVLVFLVEAVTVLRDVPAARRLHPLAMKYAGLNLLGAEMLAPMGSADRQIACLESVLEGPTANDWFDSALEMDVRMGAVVHQATTMAEYAKHLRRSGGSASRASELESQAKAMCDEFNLGRVLRLLGDRAPSPIPGASELTPRERNVLQLLSRGLSNQQIADELFISVHTAANHIRSILLKTGCSNRTQAAMLVVGSAAN